MIVQKKKDITIIYKSKNINELFYKLEEIAIDYINNLQVYKDDFYTPSVSKTYGRHPFGYFIVKKRNKLTIFHKYKDCGYLYDTVKIEKIISFYLIKKPRKFVPVERNYNELIKNASYKNDHWAHIHQDIKKLCKDEVEEESEDD